MPQHEDKTKAEVVNEFCENTSTIGVIFWWKSWPCYFWSAIWTIALIAAWGISIFQVVILFGKYFNYFTTVSVKVEHSTKANFPAVSICNANAMRYKYYKENKENFTSLNEIMEVMEKVKGGAAVNSSTQEQVTQEMSKIPSDRANSMVQYLMYSKEVDIQTAGHQLDEMLVECNFQGTLCKASDFFQWQDPSYGNCYTLAIDKDSFSSFIGPRYGLKLILYTQNHEYIPLATSDIGFRVQLHPIEYVPFPREQGFSITPGFSTSVAIKELQMKRQALPYDGSDCGQNLDRKSLFDYWSKVTEKKTGDAYANYSANTCIKQCYLETVRKTCNCYDPSAITYQYAEIYAKIQGFEVPDACDTTKRNECVDKVAAEINKGGGNCISFCNQACFEVAYVPRITNSLWPNKDYFQAMINVWKNRLPGMDIHNQDDATTALAKLEVYYEDLNFQSIKETPAMDVWDLLTNIGGIFGLYTGICFLTALEFIQLCYKLLKAVNKPKISDYGSTTPREPGRVTSFSDDLYPPYSAEPVPVPM